MAQFDELSVPGRHCPVVPPDTDKQRLDSLRAMIKGLVQMKAESDEVIDRLRRELERHEQDYAPRDTPKKPNRPR